MANHDNNNEIKEGFVDISSNKQVNKIYKKRGRAIRITSIVLSILLLIGGSGLLYYYSVLNSLKFVIFRIIIQRKPLQVHCLHLTVLSASRSLAMTNCLKIQKSSMLCCSVRIMQRERNSAEATQ